MLGFVALHVAGALKHHFISRDMVLPRMCPGVTPGVVREPRLLAIGAAALILASLAYGLNPHVAPPRPKPAKLAAADIYLDLVGPALERRCGSCHNDDLGRGGLSVASYDEVLEGGRSGPGIVPGALSKSEIYKRVNLPADHQKYMPRDEKTPLTPAQVQVIGWWISINAPRSGAVGALKPPPSLLPILSEAMGLSTSGQEQGSKIEILPKVPKGDPTAINALNSAGFTVRKVDKDSNLLDVNFYKSKSLDTSDMANLAKLQQQIRALELGNANASDADLGVIGRMPNLVSLRLEMNPITDAGVAKISDLGELRYLNLYGTKITNAGLGPIGKLPKLQRLYVWQTGVTKEAADRLAASHNKLWVVFENTSVLDGTTFGPPRS